VSKHPRRGKTELDDKKKKPKRPMTSYAAFVAATRPKIMKEHANQTFQFVAKVVGNMWQNLNTEGREPYAIIAKADSDRFQRQKVRLLRDSPSLTGRPFPYRSHAKFHRTTEGRGKP
jgi:hypothetical protein